MDLINDWSQYQLGTGRAAGKGKSLPEVIQAALADFDPPLLTLHCYEDVGYPWIQAAFDETLSPEVALRLGDRLAELLGNDKLYFNSLRPRAVYFVVDLPPQGPPDLPAARYGTLWPEIKKAWARPAARARAKGA